MQCLSCNRDVHPVQEMTAGADGGMRGFNNRCPHTDCGASLPIEPPTTVQVDASEELAMLEAELAVLETADATPENAQMVAQARTRLHFLRNPRPKPAPKPVHKTEPQGTFTVPQMAAGHSVVSPATATPAYSGSNIVLILRSRLAEIDLEAKQIRAMLAAADAVS